MRLTFIGAVFLACLSACSPTASRIQEPPKELVQQPEAPFRLEQKVEIPAEAQAMAHFVKGQMLLAEGEFNQALEEYEAAVQPIPTPLSCASAWPRSTCAKGT